MSLLTASNIKDSHILAGFYFVTLKNALDQSWKSFNTTFGPQWKDKKRSDQVRQISTLFCKLVALILG